MHGVVALFLVFLIAFPGNSGWALLRDTPPVVERSATTEVAISSGNATDPSILWQVEFSATDKGTVYTGCAAVSDNASYGDDPMDVRTSPHSYGLSFLGTKWPDCHIYSRDVKPPVETLFWVVGVSSHGQFTLNWDVSQIPGQYTTVRLIDIRTGERLVENMRNSTTITLGSGHSCVGFLVSQTVTLNPWRTQLFAAAGNVGDYSVWVGMQHDASEETDVFDVPNPPPPPGNYVDVYFPHEAYQPQSADLCGDIRSLASDMTWYFEVQSSFKTAVTLGWDMQAVPAVYKYVQLLDADNNVLVDNMRAVSQYTYTPQVAYVPRGFNFVVRRSLPPACTLTSPSASLLLSDLTEVTAEASDPDGYVASVRFEYSQDGGAAWVVIGTDNDEGDGWGVPWTTGQVAEGSNYALRAIATDNDGVSSQDESATPLKVLHTNAMVLDLRRGWNLFCLPLDTRLVSADLATVMSPEMAGVQVFFYDTSLGRYKMYPDEAIPLEPGRAYWVKVSALTRAVVYGYPVADEEFPVRLVPGWNMVSSPFMFWALWQDIKVRNVATGETTGITEAIDRGWLSKYLYRYDSGKGSYVMYEWTDPYGGFSPEAGYWAKALVDCDLIISQR